MSNTIRFTPCAKVLGVISFFSFVIFIFLYLFKDTANEAQYLTLKDYYDKVHPRPVKWTLNAPAVYVVEVHEDVLLKWLSEQSRGLFSSGVDVVLIHIDAHSDLNRPMAISNPNFPLAKIPLTIEQLKSISSRNDMFIVSAVLMKLFSKVIFLMPDWTKMENFNILNFNKPDKIGSGIYPKKTNFYRTRKSEDLCDCQSYWNYTSHVYQHYKCNLVQTNKEIDTTECLTDQVDLGYLELITYLSHAGFQRPIVSYLQSKDYVLDIDLDYFGVELPSWKLYKASQKNVANMTKFAGVITQLTKNMFCLQKKSLEDKSRQIYKDLLDSIINFETGRTCSNHDSIEISFVEEQFLLPLIENNVENINFILCLQENRDTLLNNLRNALISMKCDMSLEVLSALKNIGICYFEDSPYQQELDNMKKYPYYIMNICVGNNIPTHSAVKEYIPNDNVLNKMLRQFSKFLETLPKRPRIITFARSVRDGYTPRKYVGMLQERVLQILKQRFEIPDDNVYIDKLIFNELI